MRMSKFTRRRSLATIAAATAPVEMPHVRGSYPASKLTVGFWEHWVRAHCANQ